MDNKVIDFFKKLYNNQNKTFTYIAAILILTIVDVYYCMVLAIIYKFQNNITCSITWHISHWLKIKLLVPSQSIFKRAVINLYIISAKKETPCILCPSTQPSYL